MMRSGRLLTEESPDNLLRDYNLSSLEDVFLKLCMNDEGKNKIEQSEPLTNAVVGYTATRAQQQPIGHDNMAYDRSASQSDVSEISVDCQYTRNGHRPTLQDDLPVVRNFMIIFTILAILHFYSFTKKNPFYYSVQFLILIKFLI